MFGLGSGYVTYYGDHKQRIVIVLVSVVPLIILLTAQSGLICRCVRLNFSSAVLLRESTQNNFISEQIDKRDIPSIRSYEESYCRGRGNRN